jgi:hypothetical protein
MPGRITLLSLAALALAACASQPRIVQQWSDPAFEAHGFRRVLVLGVTKDATLRRVFEDEFSASLRARGIEAIQAYTLVPEDGQADRPRIEQAVRATRADAVILTRVLRVERRTELVPMAPMPAHPGFWGGYGAAWGGPLWPGYAQPPMVIQFDEVYVESQLWDVKTDRMVWSAVTEVFAPTNPREDSVSYSRVILDALAARGLIRAAASPR